MSGLFRTEALEYRQHAWLGGIQLIRPLSLNVLTVLVLVIAVAVAAYLSVGQYTRKARLSGYLVPDRGVIRLLPAQAGTVVERHAVEGQSVRAGDVLFVLSVDRSTLSGDTESAIKESLESRQRSLRNAEQQQAQLLNAQRASHEQQLGDLRRELIQMDAETALHRERLALAQQSLARLESLRADSFVSQAQVQTKSEEVLGLRAQAQALERQRAAKVREMGTLEAQLRELPLRALARQGEIERSLASLSQEAAESEARRSIVVRAPHDGVLAAVLAESGQSVSQQSALASLVPAHALLQAHLYAPSSAIGFVRPDQPVLLRYQAYPYQKFGHHVGRVVQVSRAPLQQSELAALPLAVALASAGPSEPMYRITVALERQQVQAYGQPQALTPGMQLDADVLLDRRRLIEWIFEPVLGVAGRV
jgi:membrane fusion protein